MASIVKAFLLWSLLLVLPACGSESLNDSTCGNISCVEGQSCVVDNGAPTCVDDGLGGTGSGNGGNGEGEGCVSSSDCGIGLTCTPGVNGVLTCQ